jgi:hypothetical protein
VSKLPIKAISVAEARLRLVKLKPYLIDLRSLYNELINLEQLLANIDAEENITKLIEARNKLTMKEDEIIDMQELFHNNDCIIKDVASGLIDFVAVRKGKLVWLCFKDGEDALEYYHEWEAGFVGRKPIDFH